MNFYISFYPFFYKNCKLMIKIETIEAGPLLNNCYIVFDENRDGVLIDAPLESADKILSFVDNEKINLKAIFLTHTHWDHFADIDLIKSSTNAPIYVHKSDEYRLLNPMQHIVFPIPVKIKKIQPDFYFEDEQIIKIGNIEYKILWTPGHTEGGVSIVIHKAKAVFTGDTLFNSSVGRVDLPGGDWETLINSIFSKLLSLPDNYVIYPGHGEISTIENEKINNPFLIY